MVIVLHKIASSFCPSNIERKPKPIDATKCISTKFLYGIYILAHTCDALLVKYSFVICFIGIGFGINMYYEEETWQNYEKGQVSPHSMKKNALLSYKEV